MSEGRNPLASNRTKNTRRPEGGKKGSVRERRGHILDQGEESTGSRKLVIKKKKKKKKRRHSSSGKTEKSLPSRGKGR